MAGVNLKTAGITAGLGSPVRPKGGIGGAQEGLFGGVKNAALTAAGSALRVTEKHAGCLFAALLPIVA